MQLILMRHGIAETDPPPGGGDAERPLSPEGLERTEAAARGLAALVDELDGIAGSPKKRARQTAQIVRGVYGKTAPAVEEWPELAVDGFAALCARLRAFEGNALLCVGHEPLLSEFVSELLTGSAAALPIEFKKAGVCALEVEWGAPDEQPRALLLWHVTPRMLRQLAR